MRLELKRTPRKVLSPAAAAIYWWLLGNVSADEVVIYKALRMSGGRTTFDRGVSELKELGIVMLPYICKYGRKLYLASLYTNENGGTTIACCKSKRLHTLY